MNCECIMYAETPAGLLEVCAGKSAVCSIVKVAAQERAVKPGAAAEQCVSELLEYFAGVRKVFTFPMALHGTEFQKRVWEALLTIPFGETRSYKGIAAQTGNAKAARAVGGAVGKNPLLIAVPCHRVIAESGKLGGFSGGIEVKKLLLDIEGIILRRGANHP